MANTLLVQLLKKAGKQMKTIKLSLAITVILTLTIGCSVFMAANQPQRKDVNVLDRGTFRNTVIAELGAPAYTEVKEGKKCDVFSFVQGYSKGAKVGRSVFHGAADVLTLGLWEVAGTPIEAMADGTEVKVEVFYDVKDTVERVNVIKGNDVLKSVTSINQRQEQKPASITADQ